MKRNYNDPVYEKYRKDVLKRDKFKCRMPNCKNKTNLQVHHIKKWSNASALRYELSNGITLCRQCHASIKNKEHHYESLFRNIIK
jgi:5-methylcytosine-specific restriction endonuclease McrA